MKYALSTDQLKKKPISTINLEYQGIKTSKYPKQTLAYPNNSLDSFFKNSTSIEKVGSAIKSKFNNSNAKLLSLDSENKNRIKFTEGIDSEQKLTKAKIPFSKLEKIDRPSIPGETVQNLNVNLVLSEFSHLLKLKEFINHNNLEDFTSIILTHQSSIVDYLKSILEEFGIIVENNQSDSIASMKEKIISKSKNLKEGLIRVGLNLKELDPDLALENCSFDNFEKIMIDSSKTISESLKEMTKKNNENNQIIEDYCIIIDNNTRILEEQRLKIEDLKIERESFRTELNELKKRLDESLTKNFRQFQNESLLLINRFNSFIEEIQTKLIFYTNIDLKIGFDELKKIIEKQTLEYSNKFFVQLDHQSSEHRLATRRLDLSKKNPDSFEETISLDDFIHFLNDQQESSFRSLGRSLLLIFEYIGKILLRVKEENVFFSEFTDRQNILII